VLLLIGSCHRRLSVPMGKLTLPVDLVLRRSRRAVDGLPNGVLVRVLVVRLCFHGWVVAWCGCSFRWVEVAGVRSLK